MKLLVVIDDAWTASLNIAVAGVLVATAVAFDAGVSPVTVGIRMEGRVEEQPAENRILPALAT